MSYSQNNEQEIILKHLGHLPTGRFLDIGAYDGFNLSNTYALYEGAWDGVLVEASPVVFVKLMETYAETVGNKESNIILVNSAVVPGGPSPMTFYDSGGDAIGTMDSFSKERWPRAKWYPILINTMSIHDLLFTVGYDFDFISIDVEGINLELFLSLPLDKLTNLKMICVEHDGKVVRMTEYLGKDWTLIDLNPENAIYLKNA